MPTLTVDSVLRAERRRTKVYIANPGLDPSGGSWSKSRLANDRACPRRAEHVYGPPGFLAWQAWAERVWSVLVLSVCDCGYYMLAASEGEGDGRDNDS